MLGMDAQEEPEELARWAAPLLQKVGGKIMHPENETFHPGVGRPKRMDYFLMDERLVGAVKTILTQAELRCQSRDSPYTIRATPHRVVRLIMKVQSVQRLKQVLRTPKRFEVAKPIGCARKPVLPESYESEKERNCGERVIAEGKVASACGGPFGVLKPSYVECLTC